MNIYDISEKAGVSIATVSRVLNNSPHVSAKTKDKVLSVIQSCSYVPNAFARGLGLNTMKTIGLLCPNAADSYLAQALSYLERTLRSHSYDCLLCCTGRELSDRIQGVKSLQNRHVDGMVMMGSTFIETNDRENEYIRQAAKINPIVLLNGSFPCENVYCVVCDDTRATQEATQHLVHTGCKRILYLYHNKNTAGQKKLAGYRAGLVKSGITVEDALIQYFAEDKMSVAHVRDHLLDLHQKGLAFDAVLTSEDILAVAAVKYARVLHQRVPEELSIIGYNNSNFCLCCEPELTSVDNKLQAICEQCVFTMLGVLEGREMPQKTVFTGELIKRESTR
ncbi:MAG: LacI family DNA-binding transcriptional regulator [Clostridia bacterium]